MYIWELHYPKHNSNVVSARLVDTLNVVFANHTTYHLAVTNFGDYSAFEIMPWYVVTVIYIGGSYGLLGVFPYARVVIHSCPETHKRQLFLNLKAIALSASQLLLFCLTVAMLTRRNKVFLKLLYSSTFILLWALFETMLTEGRSFYAYRIYLRKCSGVFPRTVPYFSQ